MGKLIGFLSIVASILSLFLYDKIYVFTIIIVMVGIIGVILQFIRNTFGENLLVAILNVVIIGVITAVISLGISFVFKSLADEVYGAIALLVFNAIHLIYNSCQYTTDND